MEHRVCTLPDSRLLRKVSTNPRLHGIIELTRHCRYAPFTYDAWKHPRTLEIISRIAGVDLIPAIDLEISNINIATQGFSDGEAKESSNGDLPATKWHYDSYPFVCVVMLSDTTNMIGGETAIRKPSGEVIRVRGPQRVCSCHCDLQCPI